MSRTGGRGEESNFIGKRKTMENYCFMLPLTALLVKYQTLGPDMRQRPSAERVSCLGGTGALAVELCAHSCDDFWCRRGAVPPCGASIEYRILKRQRMQTSARRALKQFQQNRVLHLHLPNLPERGLPCKKRGAIVVRRWNDGIPERVEL